MEKQGIITFSASYPTLYSPILAQLDYCGLPVWEISQLQRRWLCLNFVIHITWVMELVVRTVAIVHCFICSGRVTKGTWKINVNYHLSLLFRFIIWSLWNIGQKSIGNQASLAVHGINYSNSPSSTLHCFRDLWCFVILRFFFLNNRWIKSHFTIFSMMYTCRII